MSESGVVAQNLPSRAQHCGASVLAFLQLSSILLFSSHF
jgi:hypothetical protein